jgi:rare lipoprotein A (peptidoglycan hydrolase)
MPKFGSGRRTAALCLLISGSTFLIAIQRMLNPAAAAQTDAVIDVHNLQPRPETISSDRLGQVDSAMVSGQFEDMVEPTDADPAPTDARNPGLFETGIASTYGEGDGFEGNRTACGQIFHTSSIQIAHKTLPCGTLVRVEDANTGRSIVAPVTDRGPYVPGRVVDLSWAAFKQLDPDGPGLLHVNVYLMDT